MLINGEYSCVTVPLIRLLSDILQIYSEEDRSKMPLELSSALSHDREAVEDSEIRQQTLEAIYMIVLQVFQYSMGSGFGFIVGANSDYSNIFCSIVLRCLNQIYSFLSPCNHSTKLSMYIRIVRFVNLSLAILETWVMLHSFSFLL